MARNFLTAPFDAATQLSDGATTHTANAAGQVASANKVLDIGSGFCPMVLDVNVTAMDITSGDEGYTIELQGSNDSSFATGVVVLNRVSYGKATAINESADRGLGRQQKEVLNSVDGVNTLRYVRAFVRVAGTTPSIAYTAFLTKSPVNA